MPEEFDYTPLMHIAAVLVVATVVYAVSRRAFDHHLRSAMTSDRRTGITFLRNGVKGGILFATALAVIYCVPLHCAIKQRFDAEAIPLGRPSQVNYPADLFAGRREAAE